MRSLLQRAFTTVCLHYAENECAMPIRLNCNELRVLCLTTNALCRTAEIGALLLKCVLIVYIWPEKRCMRKKIMDGVQLHVHTCATFSTSWKLLGAFCCNLIWCVVRDPLAMHPP